MMTSEKSQQNLSDYNQFLFKKDLNLIKKGIISRKKREIPVILTMIMLNRSLERIFNPSSYTG